MSDNMGISGEVLDCGGGQESNNNVTSGGRDSATEDTSADAGDVNKRSCRTGNPMSEQVTLVDGAEDEDGAAMKSLPTDPQVLRQMVEQLQTTRDTLQTEHNTLIFKKKQCIFEYMKAVIHEYTKAAIAREEHGHALFAEAGLEALRMVDNSLVYAPADCLDLRDLEGYGQQMTSYIRGVIIDKTPLLKALCNENLLGNILSYCSSSDLHALKDVSRYFREVQQNYVSMYLVPSDPVMRAVLTALCLHKGNEEARVEIGANFLSTSMDTFCPSDPQYSQITSLDVTGLDLCGLLNWPNYSPPDRVKLHNVVKIRFSCYQLRCSADTFNHFMKFFPNVSKLIVCLTDFYPTANFRKGFVQRCLKDCNSSTDGLTMPLVASIFNRADQWWHNCKELSVLRCINSAIGHYSFFAPMEAPLNLREVWLDGAVLSSLDPGLWLVQSFCTVDKLSCWGMKCKPLEQHHRDSARYLTDEEMHYFVSLAQNLKWFRSHMTMEAITVLRQEHPGITFVRDDHPDS